MYHNRKSLFQPIRNKLINNLSTDWSGSTFRWRHLQVVSKTYFQGHLALIEDFDVHGWGHVEAGVFIRRSHHHRLHFARVVIFVGRSDVHVELSSRYSNKSIMFSSRILDHNDVMLFWSTIRVLKRSNSRKQNWLAKYNRNINIGAKYVGRKHALYEYFLVIERKTGCIGLQSTTSLRKL